MAFGEALDQAGQPGQGVDVGSAEADPAGQRFARADMLTNVGYQSHELRRIGQEFAALGREDGLAVGTLEQLDAERVLQLADSRGDRRLRGFQLPGGGMKAAEPADPVERLVLPKVHERCRSSAAALRNASRSS
jgi:hypothetical protein